MNETFVRTLYESLWSILRTTPTFTGLFLEPRMEDACQFLLTRSDASRILNVAIAAAPATPAKEDDDSPPWD